MLYKYFPPTRDDLFSKLSIRFTQLFAFNDPFEGRPHIVFDLNREQSLESLERTAKEDKWPDQMYQEIKEKYENGEVDKHWPDIMKFMVHIMASITVCMSLTETYDNLLMWAHYAQNHEGFVIGFDESHSFIKGPGDGIYKLTQIKYTTDRPNLGISKLQHIDTYFTKSKEWAYEKEWRVFADINNADQVINSKPYPICLFKVPPDSITEVIFGCRIDSKTRDAIIGYISSNDSLKHITIKQAMINENHYKLDMKNKS